jgi:chorismate synthase
MKAEVFEFGGGFSIFSAGESHGEIETTVAGCPPNIELSPESFELWLEAGRPGRNPLVTPRNESDLPILKSGVRKDGLTDGRKSPIRIVVESKDTAGRNYRSDLIKPGHGNAAAVAKDGGQIPEGSGRLSVRPLRLGFVLGGVVAKQFLDAEADGVINGIAWVEQVGDIKANVDGTPTFEEVFSSPVSCPDRGASAKIEEYIASLRDAHKSIGARVRYRFSGVPAGYGTPPFAKLQAVLNGALWNINAVRATDLGLGADAVSAIGNEYNDAPVSFSREEGVTTKTNNAGGIQSGMSMGPNMPIEGSVTFHATSSVGNMPTISFAGEESVMDRPDQKDDPCVGLRAPIIVMGVGYCTLAGAALDRRLDY